MRKSFIFMLALSLAIPKSLISTRIPTRGEAIFGAAYLSFIGISTVGTYGAIGYLVANAIAIKAMAIKSAIGDRETHKKYLELHQQLRDQLELNQQLRGQLELNQRPTDQNNSTDTATQTVIIASTTAVTGLLIGALASKYFK